MKAEKNNYIFQVDDTVLVAPQVTGEKDWIEAKITEIEDNPFIGTVINVITPEVIIFFEKPDMFKPLIKKNT
ncbi:Transcription termination/antitermination protein NusG [Candidatus Ornithobacterium hominis]|uniref:transcriptional regulator n=1 Tax=Candidatus Ornithobacterium hominis TaxID=2497989 RepID=UPI0024BC4D5F|nr:transcriptional regulator [Candidatus Ornithobacterium hominis]CAI9429402.1 Transcription termination/antitermination protein NusG [Candidatus Ornithobacterium hominis]